MSAETLPKCHEGGCKNVALADFVVCYEHVRKDSLMGYINDLRMVLERHRANRGIIAAPSLPPTVEALPKEAVRLLEAVHTWTFCPTDGEREDAVIDAWDEFVAAGKPGLPQEQDHAPTGATAADAAHEQQDTETAEKEGKR